MISKYSEANMKLPQRKDLDLPNQDSNMPYSVTLAITRVYLY